MPHILARGADWFRSMGTDESPGTIVATVVGDVVGPDVGEVELGTPLRAVIDAVGGGVGPGRTVKAVFSGVANPVVTAADLDVPVSYEGFQAIGSGMGAAGFIVYDDTTCMVDAAYRLLAVPLRRVVRPVPAVQARLGEITEHLERIETGGGTDDDIAAIGGWLDHVTDGNRCYLAVEEQVMVEQHPAGVPRGVRRAHRARPVPAAAPPADPEARRPRRRRGRLRRVVLAQATGLDLRARIATARPFQPPTRAFLQG